MFSKLHLMFAMLCKVNHLYWDIIIDLAAPNREAMISWTIKAWSRHSSSIWIRKLPKLNTFFRLSLAIYLLQGRASEAKAYHITILKEKMKGRYRCHMPELLATIKTFLVKYVIQIMTKRLHGCKPSSGFRKCHRCV